MSAEELTPEKPNDTTAGMTEKTDQKQDQQTDQSKRRRNPFLAILPGTILILLGIIFLISYYGYLGGEWWQYFVVGLGVLFVIETWIHHPNLALGRFRYGRIVSGIILVIGGLLFLFNPSWWLPLVLIGVGVILVMVFILRREHKAKK